MPDDKVTRLHPVGATRVSADAKARVVAELELALKEAREGKITEILLVLKHPNTEWSVRSNDLGSMLEWVGRVSLIKRDMMNMLAGPIDETEDDDDE